jgi:hypothetical protein
MIVVADGPGSWLQESTAPLRSATTRRAEGMLIYTRMGWLVPAIWLAAVAASSQVSADAAEDYGMGLSRVACIFFVAAALSTPLVFLAGAVLNREKMPQTIRRFGKEKEVLWGTHTFYMAPIGFWVIVIPVATVASYFIFPLLF